MSEMERDLISCRRRALSCFSCSYMMPPSCFTVQEEMEYSRIHRCSSRRRWKNLLRILVRDGKNGVYGSKPLSFYYDAVSYSQNFDEGCHRQESGHYQQVFSGC
ncbi:putative beta-glucosidase [Hibiscus syriacus]|uniref:Beta-glucosidase n=1 Tax=Hibiscus syriacus TaxID=106335 RepID=A0A6A2Y5W2_HIBSY|nr:putative beta-glucosidase [Hibiscus syriacus]